MPDVNNNDRAEWAQTGLDAFAVEIGGRGEPLAQNMGDLLADLMHLCDREGIDFKDVLRVAETHYTEETELDGLLNPRGKRRGYSEACGPKRLSAPRNNSHTCASSKRRRKPKRAARKSKRTGRRSRRTRRTWTTKAATTTTKFVKKGAVFE